MLIKHEEIASNQTLIVNLVQFNQSSVAPPLCCPARPITLLCAAPRAHDDRHHGDDVDEVLDLDLLGGLQRSEVHK